jgi:hypothetical protein
LNIPLLTFIFSFAHHFLFNTWSSKVIRPINTSLCVLLYRHVEAFNIIIMSERCKFHLMIIPHL